MLPELDCAAALEARTGCDSADFEFSTPSRNRVIDCRLPLVRESDARAAKPSCDNVDETLRNCPDLITFLGGRP
jgi:hypothetical protein